MADHLGIKRGTRESYSPDDFPKAKLKRAVRALGAVAEDMGIKEQKPEDVQQTPLPSITVHPDDVLVVQHPTPSEFSQGVRFELPANAILAYPARAKSNALGRARYFEGPNTDFVPRDLHRKPVQKTRIQETLQPPQKKSANKANFLAKIMKNTEV